MREDHSQFEADIAAVAAMEVIPGILDVICRITGMGFAAVARVTETRWITCAVRDDIAFGLKTGGELKVETTICSEIRRSGQVVVIDHVAEDPKYRHHPTPAMYGFQSYISVPVHRGREFFGTLCAIDPRPARVNRPEIIQMFQLFAELIGAHLNAAERLAVSQTELDQEREISGLREQFIAVLGHDLRNPLAAIDTSALVLITAKAPDHSLVSQMAMRIRKSTARMAGMIDNMMDFARGRLGGGLTLTRAVSGDLNGILEHVVAEMRTHCPECEIQSDIAIERPVSVDAGRVGQLLSNLLSNALTHGTPAGTIQVRARSSQAGFELTVSNQGQPIPPETVERLFHPFARGASTTDSTGLGLGLYIASEIANAHGGTLSVSSDWLETRFTFALPPA